MIKTGTIKKCKTCKKEFYVKKCLIKKKFYCSKPCSDKGKIGRPNNSATKFRKGHKTWNTGFSGKGICKANSGSFKKGKSHPFFIGKLKHKGYILVYSPYHPFAKKDYVPEHRLVMEKHLGRFLKPQEIPHHINEIRDDNRIENLELFATKSNHAKHHWPNGFHPNRKIK